MLVVAFSLLSAILPPPQARADLKKTGTILAVAGLGLVGAGVVMYVTRGDEEYNGPPELHIPTKKSTTPALIVGGAGVGLMSIGVALRKKAERREQGVSLELEPRPGAIALAARF